MEKAMYPSKVMRITQKHGIGTHKNNYAVDEAGLDSGIGNIIAPFTGIIRKIYTADANEVWLESVDKVEYPDGTIDYMTILFAHANDVSNLKVGQIIKQGQVFYQEGTKGQATGNHCHFECGRGKFTGTGWHQDGNAWDINNGKLVTDCLWIDDSYTIKNSAGYNFKNTKSVEVKYFGSPVPRDESKIQIEIKKGATTVRARTSANGNILGYMNSGIYNILEVKNTSGYTWYKVEEGLWFAYNPDWATIHYPKNNDSSAEELRTTVELLQKKLAEKEEIINNLTAGTTELTNAIIDKDKEMAVLKEQLVNAPKLIFECKNTDYYAIKLNENQKLYLE